MRATIFPDNHALLCKLTANAVSVVGCRRSPTWDVFDEVSSAANDAGSFVTVVPTAMEEHGGGTNDIFNPYRLGLVAALSLPLVVFSCHTKTSNEAGITR